uniref:Uncharacterized protein n=1 Tax=Vitis vinifera TaxID=29760 RepID=A5AHC3_VITVI|nr:hypothetical protein VITISV_000839 [Vitis vinifera]
MLRQALGGNRLIATSTVCSPTKKKPDAKTVKKAPTLAPVSLSASTSFVFVSLASTALNSEVELVVPRIIYEPKGEKDMAVNLRASFKERQHKCLSESIVVATLLAKRPCSEETREAPAPDTPLMLISLTDVAGPNNVLVAKSPIRKDTCPTQYGAPTGPDPTDDDLDKKDATAPLRSPNWEEMAKMLKQVTKAMGAFITEQMGGSEELRAKLEWVESDLAIAQKVAADGAEAKNDITQDTPSYPSDDENATPNSSAQGNGVLSAAEPFDG